MAEYKPHRSPLDGSRCVAAQAYVILRLDLGGSRRRVEGVSAVRSIREFSADTMLVQTYTFLGMTAVFASTAMLELLRKIHRLAPLDEVVIIEGESGSGKEIVARAIHHFSRRAAKPWVDINCAALPENLLESELFGYEKGAFSGADAKKPGLIELAEGGTLFLDEIGELDLRLQAKLLRVLDSGEFFRLGGTKKVKVDGRIVVATNRNLEKAMQERRFREDLYYRLTQLQLRVPSLRDRSEDILPIAEFFRKKHQVEASFSPEAKEALLRYQWPGNVRQLRNVVIACGAESNGPEIRVEDLPPIVQCGSQQPANRASDLVNLAIATGSGGGDEQPPGGILEATEKMLILETLGRTAGNQIRAAAMLGVSTRTLSRKLKAYSEQTTREAL